MDSFLNLLTPEQQAQGYFLDEDEDFLYLKRGEETIATFSSSGANTSEIMATIDSKGVITKLTKEQKEATASIHDLRFDRVAMAKCVLHPFTLTMPERKMRRLNDQWLCPECFEQQKKAWRMDKEKSYARLEVTPVRNTEGLIYHLNENIEIKPYPNPFMYGGKYGGSCVKSKEELDQAIARFQKEADELRQNGMEKVEVITHDETVHIEQPKLVEVKVKETVKQAALF